MSKQLVKEILDIFDKSIRDYHVHDHIDAPLVNPFPGDAYQHIFYLKNWIDTVQWHLEDHIRDRKIDPVYALELKRKIDSYNQHRTDVVEKIDQWFYLQYQHVKTLPGAGINTETPAWAFDRLSILCLKIYHMKAEVLRPDISSIHKVNCKNKLQVLEEQMKDLTLAIMQLLDQIERGEKVIKMYKQMKMYNDPLLNPVLYKK